MDTKQVFDIVFTIGFYSFIVFLFWALFHKPKPDGRWAKISAKIDKDLDSALTRIGQIIGAAIFLFVMYLLCQLGLFGIILAIIITLIAISICNFISKIKG